MSISNIFEPVLEQLRLVEELICNKLNESDEFISKLLNCFNNCGGKMIRPGLVLLSGTACGKIVDEHIRVAAILEMIHNATLLHDDVIDEGKKRRGKATVNSLYSNEAAVLLGDFVLTKVFEMCTELPMRVSKIIVDTVKRTCKGELSQVSQKGNWQLSESEYINIITDKSAALFETSCYLGALLSDADEESLDSFKAYGRNVGIAFQITDDLLDIVGSEEETGKTLGSDADGSKVTLSTIHFLSNIKEHNKNEVLQNLIFNTQTRDLFKKTLESNASLDYAANRALRFVENAINAVNFLPQSEVKTALIRTANAVVDRIA